MNYSSLLRLSALFLLLASLASAEGITYVILWFDTEDYILPAADDAALRIANEITALGVSGTFKIVGEKARTLEKRGRTDVIQALSKQCIGYHSDFHSVQPTPAVYLKYFGLIEGADEFLRREQNGFSDVSRIFGKKPACYGQPGASWAPQVNLSLRRLGIQVYLDDGIHVGLNDQPMWYDGLLYVFNLGRYQLRADLDHPETNAKTFKEFDDYARHFAATGSGLISTYYHPTEFVTTEFWDAANFLHGASREREQWVMPKRRTAEDTERCYRILHDYLEHAKRTPNVRFVTAADLLQIYADPIAPQVDVNTLARHFQAHITFLSTPAGDLSAADILLQLLGLPAEYVDGPTRRESTTYRDSVVPNPMFDRAVADAKSFIQTNHRLPSEVFLGAEILSLPDFAATLAVHLLSPGPVHIIRGKPAFEQYVSNDPRKAFDWPIHPRSFSAPELLDMARLQAWTLKPARFRRLTP